MKTKVQYFKEGGKFYIEEEIDLPADARPWHAVEYLPKDRLRGMHAHFSEHAPWGFPVLVTADQRGIIAGSAPRTALVDLDAPPAAPGLHPHGHASYAETELQAENESLRAQLAAAPDDVAAFRAEIAKDPRSSADLAKELKQAYPPPAAPDALGEAIALAAEWSKTEDLPPGLRALLEKARAAHAEEIAAARAMAAECAICEQEIDGSEEAPACESCLRKLIAARDDIAADLAAARAEVEGLRKERDAGYALADRRRQDRADALQERDTALARAEKEKRSREEWQRSLDSQTQQWDMERHLRAKAEQERDALRASLAAAQEREGKMREALREVRPAFVDLRHGEDCSRTESCEDSIGAGPCDGGALLDECPRATRPEADCCDRHGHKGCPECSCTVECLRVIDTALAQPAPAVPEAAPRPGEVERIKVLEGLLEQVRAAWPHGVGESLMKRIDAALSAPAKERP